MEQPFEFHSISDKGGGQHSLNEEVAMIQLRWYCLSKFKRPIGCLQPQQRAQVAFILSYVLELHKQQVASLLCVTLQTVYNDLSSACYNFNHVTRYREEVRGIYKYISLYSRRLP